MILFFLLRGGSLFSQTLADSFSLKTDFQAKPSFYEESSPYLVNRGGYVYIGQTSQSDQTGIYFYNLKDKKKIFETVPIREYVSKHPSLLQEGAAGWKEDAFPFSLTNLLFYDVKEGQAGFIVEHSHFKLPNKKFYFFVWNLNANRIEFVEEIHEKKGSDKSSYAMALPIGFDTVSKQAYFAFAVDANMADKTANDVDVSVYKYSEGKLKKVYNYADGRFPYNIIYHESSGKVLLQTYVESYENNSPKGRLLDLNTLDSISVVIPTVPYGACFSKDGSRFYLASSDTGELQVYETNTGKSVKKVKLGTHGHSMGFWKENELVWVRNSGIHIYDVATLKQKKLIPTKNYYKGQINVSGSLVIPDFGILLRNGFEGPDGAAGFRLLLSYP
ncbi:YncE family protein [Leptospira idonii]|uniref:WD40 repeat domain-containing protein n=1 Tax=Leptospira idonii TaxID=1193500 RepID=A0A4R9LU24_9LEPT|nr:hypothetical protein [Leptospira idonii]TGN17266.1 hypothetical protein EHS15_17145 [Leptospira idonii]